MDSVKIKFGGAMDDARTKFVSKTSPHKPAIPVIRMALLQPVELMGGHILIFALQDVRGAVRCAGNHVLVNLIVILLLFSLI